MKERYTYRNLPCTDRAWCVFGTDESLAIREGVLEWCDDQADAQDRASKMGKHKQFTHLEVRHWPQAE